MEATEIAIANSKPETERNTCSLTVQGEDKVAKAAVGEDAESISSSPNQKFECPCN
ncbi:hypothetical protein [Peribacillus simplex]|uniref:hypothetical protein n=1 Tax=Peribacillus simplex TaxID=1478 RepID=UPI003D274643